MLVQYLLIIFFSFVFSSNAYCKETWDLLYKPKQRIVKAIAAYKEKIFIGTEHGVLVSKDKGKSWIDFGTEKLLKDSNGNSTINWIFTDENKEKIFIATNFGAYFSDIRKPEWKKLPGNIKTDLNIVNSITVNEEIIYLSTNDGFWVCDYKENTCKRLNNGIEPDPISGNYEAFYSLKSNNNTYLTTTSGIYSLDKKNDTWINLTGNIQKLPDGRVNAKHLININNQLWAACGTGVYVIEFAGNSWQKITEGIKQSSDGFQEAFYLHSHNNMIFLATANGAYYLDDNVEWIDLSDGIREKESTKNVYQIVSFKNNLLAATDEGLFTRHVSTEGYTMQSEARHCEEQSDPHAPLGAGSAISKTLRDCHASLSAQADPSSGRCSARNDSHHEESTNNRLVLKGKIEKVIANLNEVEPSVIEVQKQALKFASLPTNNDYKRYRLLARIRNLVPKVGFDLNSTGSNINYYQLEKGISANVNLNNTFNSDKLTRLQRDGGTLKQFSVAWNANELFYDDEIREILNQARLTANIKENILDDVTRIYFQRRKLQFESLTQPDNSLENKLEKELEIALLTGQLDSRTGGWFSSELERRKRRK